MNPYEANPEKIPETGRYADVPLYGRYFPQPGDFQPNPEHILSTSVESLTYWSSVLDRCDASVRIYENIDGGRDVFALGSVIIKSSHLKERLEGRRADQDYSYADMNEAEVTTLAKKVLGDVKAPCIYFASQVNGRHVLVQERIPRVGLNIAWQYISSAQKALFKQQARHILRQLHSVKPPPSHRGSSTEAFQELERDIMFSASNDDSDVSFMHNDFSLSNYIVDNDKIVGLVDWEMADYFGWKTAGAVHVQIRTPKRENFAALNLSEARLDDILFWNDLYADDA